MLELGQIGAGTVFGGRYRIDRLLKAGGMGAVYVAEHTTTRKRVALKLMRPEIVASESARARFIQEAQASALIESSNVVDVYDAGVDADTNAPFIVMELLAGKELGELVNERGRLTQAEVVDYLAQAARALDRAHAAGVVHRDLKPDNLFLAMRDGEPPRIKILDFGIAKFLASSGGLATQATGTPLYMAPEQTRRGATIGPETDVWALGLIAYTLLVGRPYWDAEDIHELFAEVLAGAHEPATQRAMRAGVSLPASFDAWFFGCVASNQAARFRQAGQAAGALAVALGVPLAPSLGSSSPAVGERLRWLSTIEDASTIGDERKPLEEASTIGNLANVSHAANVATPTTTPTAAPITAPVVASAAAPMRRGGRWAITALVAVGALGLGGFAAFRVLGAKLLRVGSRPVALALGLADASCALDEKGGVRCVGASFVKKGASTAPEALALPGAAKAVVVGKHHGCARLVDSTVACWGENATGELGDGTERAHAPMAIPGLRNVEQIALNIHGGCARLAEGRVRCWGGNKYGQVGDRTTSLRLAPVDVEGAAGAVSIALGQDHACALFGDGLVRCWGRNVDGELGTADRSDHPTPAPVEGLEGATSIALGGHFSCAVVRDGTARCWGSNADGELGDGASGAARRSPAAVAGLEGVTQLTAGWKHACARLRDGDTRCWGQNTFGQLGDGTTTTRPTPVTLKERFVEVVAGRMHTCAVLLDGGVSCWGRNEEGQLGDGTTHNRLEPTHVTW